MINFRETIHCSAWSHRFCRSSRSSTKRQTNSTECRLRAKRVCSNRTGSLSRATSAQAGTENLCCIRPSTERFSSETRPLHCEPLSTSKVNSRHFRPAYCEPFHTALFLTLSAFQIIAIINEAFHSIFFLICVCSI